jgi:hypothetical protein
MNRVGNPFEIVFYKPKGKKQKKNYPDEIRSILKFLNFEWSGDDQDDKKELND